MALLYDVGGSRLFYCSKREKAGGSGLHNVGTCP